MCRIVLLNLFGVIGVAYFDVQQFVDNPPLERNVIYQYGCAGLHSRNLKRDKL